jgi:hypothetical protein
MAISLATKTFDPYSVEWWMRRLVRRLRARKAGLDELASFHDGNQPLIFLAEQYRRTVGRKYGDNMPANFMTRVVDAEKERLTVTGFRYGDETESDREVWRIWQDNQLDAESQIAHEIALVKGIAYALVTPSSDGALITIEDPCETIVETSPGSRRLRAAGLKMFGDEEGYQRIYLYLPNEVYRFRSVHKYVDENEDPRGDWSMENATWEPFDGDDFEAVIPNPLQTVPLVPLANRPRRDGTGRSEIEPVIGNQLAINKLRFDMLVASETVAFPQRWFTNIDIPINPDTGQPLAPFKPGLDVLWGVRRPTPAEMAEYGDKMPQPQFGQFDQAQLTPYIDAIRQEIVELAAISATPYYQLVGPPTSVAPSGESIKSSEAALVKKSKGESIHLGEGWEETMRLALIATGQASKARTDAETMWADFEMRSEAVRTQSVMLQWEKGLIPDDFALEELGYSQQTIRRIKAMREAQKADEEAVADVEPMIPIESPNGVTPIAMVEV